MVAARLRMPCAASVVAAPAVGAIAHRPVSANGVLQTWIHGITAGTLCTTRAHGSARATMYTQLAAHSIERGTTYSTCVHCTKLDTAYTLHRPQLVRTSIPAAQLMHSVPTAVPPTPHLSGAGTICDTMHTTCAQGTGADVPCGSLSGRGIAWCIVVPAECNLITAGTGHGTMYSS